MFRKIHFSHESLFHVWQTLRHRHMWDKVNVFPRVIKSLGAKPSSLCPQQTHSHPAWSRRGHGAPACQNHIVLLPRGVLVICTSTILLEDDFTIMCSSMDVFYCFHQSLDEGTDSHSFNDRSCFAAQSEANFQLARWRSILSYNLQGDSSDLCTEAHTLVWCISIKLISSSSCSHRPLRRTTAAHISSVAKVTIPPTFFFFFLQSSQTHADAMLEASKRCRNNSSVILVTAAEQRASSDTFSHPHLSAQP